MRHSLNKLIMQAWSKTKLNMDLWKWHMNLIKTRASKWAELNHWPDSCMCFDFTAETSKASTLWGLPDSTVPPPPTDYKAASCLFGSNYRKHRYALFGKVQATTSPTVVESPEVWSEGSRLAQPRGSPQTQTGAPTEPSQPISPHPTGDTRPITDPVLCTFIVCPNYQLNAPTWLKKSGCKRVGKPGFLQGMARKMQSGWSTNWSCPYSPTPKSSNITYRNSLPKGGKPGLVYFLLNLGFKGNKSHVWIQED